MRVRRIMKGALVGSVVAIAVLFFVGILLAGWFLSELRHTDYFERELEKVLKVDVQIESSTVSFRRGVGIQFSAVRIAEPGAGTAIVTSERIDLIVQLKALLQGNLLFQRIVFFRPHIHFGRESTDVQPTTLVNRLFFKKTGFELQEDQVVERVFPHEELGSGDSWITPELRVEQLVLDGGELVIHLPSREEPIVFSKAQLRLTSSLGGRVSVHLETDLGREAEAGKLFVRTFLGARDPVLGNLPQEWHGDVRLQGMDLDKVGEWFGIKGRELSVDFTGNYSGGAAVPVHASGVVTLRNGNFAGSKLEMAKIAIHDIRLGTEENEESIWTSPSSLELFFENLEKRLASLIFAGAIEEVRGSLGRRRVPLRFFSGDLQIEGGDLTATRLEGVYGRGVHVNSLDVHWPSIFSSNGIEVEVELAAITEVSDSFNDLTVWSSNEEIDQLKDYIEIVSGKVQLTLIGRFDTRKYENSVYKAKVEWEAGKARLTKSGVGVDDIKGIIQIEPGTVRSEGIEFRIGEGAVQLNGFVEWPFSLQSDGELRLSFAGANAAPLTSILMDDDLFSDHGVVTGDVSLLFGSGQGGFISNGQVSIQNAHLNVLPFLEPLDIQSGRLSWEGKNGKFIIDEAEFPGGSVVATGDVVSFEPLDIRVSAECKVLDLDDSLLKAGLQKASDSADDKSNILVDFRCEKVSYERFEAMDVAVTVHKHARQTDFAVQSSRTSGGTVTGEGTFWLDSDALSLSPKIENVDATNFLATLGHPTEAISGELSAIGKLEFGKWQFWDQPQKWDGFLEFDIRNGITRKLPILVKLWTAVSLQSILNFSLPNPAAEGLPFSSLTGNLNLAGGLLRTQDLSLTGDAVRLDSQGQFNLSRRSVDLLTNVIPLHGITSIVQRVPLAGKLLADSTDLLTTLPFEVRGPFDAPEVRLKLLKKVVP